VSWGKVDPDRLPDTITCYCDSTIVLPILTAYSLARCKPRPLKKLYFQREQMMEQLKREYREAK
jgi:deoxyhypusine synthase